MKFFDKFQKFLGKNILRKKSVYFLSFNKCGTTLFNNYVLEDLVYHKKIDYLSLIYCDIKCNVEFNDYGNVYGIIKVGNKSGTLYEKVISVVLSEDFIKDKTVIFLVRDPRDILVSEYYSYGFTHGFSSNADIRKFQESQRREIQNLSLDEYVLKNSLRMNDDFMKISNILKKCKCGKILKYEDLINNHTQFIDDLNRVLPMKTRAINRLYIESRPEDTEDLTSHKRSGKVYGFVDKLSSDTIDKANKILACTLDEFSYPIFPK